jgi:transposase
VHCIARGWSIAALAREFNLSRHTVRRYVETDVAPRYAPRACPANLNQVRLAHVVRRLGVSCTIRATTLYREVKVLGYEAGYPSFARRVRGLRQQRHKEPTVRFVNRAGSGRGYDTRKRRCCDQSQEISTGAARAGGAFGGRES